MLMGIIGNGYVGGAVRAFLEAKQEQVRVFDLDPARSIHSRAEVAQTDLVFLCVPTPTREGRQDLAAVWQSLIALNQLVGSQQRVVPVMIKSTILPGTSRKLQAEFPHLRIVFNPEFLTARTAVHDFAHPPAVILGFGQDPNDLILRLHREWFPWVHTVVCQWEEAELLKYTCNTFFAVRAGFWNGIYDLCKALGVEYSTLAAGAHKLTSHIQPSYCTVPGPDGQRGFGGACLPKDGWALLGLADTLGVDLSVLRATLEANLRHRPETDLGLRNRSSRVVRVGDGKPPK